ncbi:MAG: cellulose biosynthesis protein BcsS [Brevundimonas sp.]
MKGGMAAGVLGCILAASAASAQDRGVVFAGGEVSEDSSGYFGVTWAMPGSALGRGWAIRGTASLGGYDYDRAPGTVDAEFVQGDVVLLHQTSGAWGYFNVGGGARITDTDLEPADPGNQREGSNWDIVLTADGMRNAGDWRFGGYGSYGVDMREYYLRGEVTRRLGSGSFRAGLEVVSDGDENYDRAGAGALLVYEPSRAVGWRAAIGSRDDGDVYFSVGVTQVF